jgi:acyl-CoA thioester hydrolase
MEHRIYYHDTDSGGVVYYANYLKYFEEARTEFLLDRGVDIVRLLDRGFVFAVRSCEVAYKAPARYSDILCADAVLEKASAAQLFFRQRAWNKDTGTVFAEATIALVFLNRAFKPCAMPPDMRKRLI